MKPKDIFKLAVRILGLAFVYHGLTGLPPAAPAISTALIRGQFVTFLLTLVFAVWPLAVACWLLRGAPLIMRIAYPETADKPQPGSAAVDAHNVDA